MDPTWEREEGERKGELELELSTKERGTRGVETYEREPEEPSAVEEDEDR